MRWLVLLFVLLSAPLRAEPLAREALAALISAPYALGEPLNDRGVWSLLNSGGGEAGYVFETGPLAPLPGFSGQPINILVLLDLDGAFIDTRLLGHNEPIFVSGLGEAPLRQFLSQYRGHSINQPLVVGNPYGAGSGSDLVYLDGVTKATASIRIAHESILAAALAVARERMQGVTAGPPPRPDPGYAETLDWDALIAKGLVRHLRVGNAEVQAAFAGTKWADDDPEAAGDPEGTYLDLYAVDIGPPAIARAVLSPDTLAEIEGLAALALDDELLLLIEAGRHGLVSDAFVRNTAPDLLGAMQDGLPLALRDADMLAGLSGDIPEDLQNATRMILRLDRRLGFDPSRDWQLVVQAPRRHGMFQPETGTRDFTLAMGLPDRFFRFPERAAPPAPPWLDALHNRSTDLMLLAAGLAGLFLLLWRQGWLATRRRFTVIRLAILAVTIGFVGFWGQGQLSIVTPLAVIRSAVQGGGLAVLLYDPFSLLVWVAAILGFLLWGRGLFCGWLCPYGAMQEFAHHLGRRLGLREWQPPRAVGRALLWSGPVALVLLVATAFLAPQHAETVAEIEPFKTAITTHFARPWPYVLWAGGWVAVSLVWFKGYCRTLCPLGALMRLGGLLRLRRWIPRRAECGSPCQLCRVRCRYDAIAPKGQIRYSECFQCLDCVTIHDDPAQCVPLRLQARGRRLAA
ncbi:4Fe-4S binding protein [Paracoccus marinaquae]|uniref:4Fe-4S binding protein n=1 Tax=Paracoccus marinaquae TaxID=2841926 RepID=A0ABS6AE74_9RHOB|nr:4Fe-4S binding protein [Paracoccus marinaquae]MBU3028913.1 4Fe-4S binding protein [Paracoccus marinaquae]